ncbi:MAG: DNA primase [Puniceicoccales bacterium]|jgi:DNA primase|nr:DNA primase [Puniceicoccales bacterium]
MIKRECIERVKAVADLYDIVSGYVQLKRSGSNWKGLSPFTTEKTPSFFVLPEKRFFKCFSTGYAGDVFRFLELKENFSFLESVEWLAKRYGIALEYEGDGSTKTHTKSKNELFDLHGEAMAYFRKKFLENPRIQDYWQRVRHFSLEAAERYGIGWAPPGDRDLLSLLKKKGYGEEALEQCGLFLWNTKDKKNWNFRFAGRLIIPIQDVQDRVIGFSGRITEAKDDGFAKYINSPESPIFHKGGVLYGLNHARRSTGGPLVIVEGQLDAIRCWESGIHGAVAPQGTGLTETQMHLLRRYTSQLICLMDGDGAGQKCALRLVELSFKAAMESQIVTLPEADDPDSFLLRMGKTGFEDLKRESMIAFLCRTCLPQGVEATAIEKANFLEKVYGMIHGSDSEVTREIYLDELAQQLQLNRHAIGNDFRNFCGDRKFTLAQPVVSPSPEKKTREGKLRTAEYDLLSLVLHHEDLGLSVAYLLEDAWLEDGEQGRLLLKVLNEMQAHTWEGPRSDNPIFSPDEVNELFSILATEEDGEDPVAMANACIRSICATFARKQLEKINQKASEQRKFTKNKNLLDDPTFFEKLQAEKLRLRQLLISCPRIGGGGEGVIYGK